MAKTTVLKKQQKQQIPDFDFSDLMMNSPDDDVVLGMMSELIEAHHHHQQTAIELTKMAVEKNASKHMTEEEIFSTFKRASQAVLEVSPIKELFEKMHG